MLPVDARLVSVNVARVRPNPHRGARPTAIDKRPTGGPVEVRAPGSRAHGLGSGLVGDSIGNRSHHGGDDQALYAYAREDLDRWESELGRPLTAGAFGENLTTRGVDVSGALVGERWRVGPDVVLQVTDPRIPCSTFRAWMGVRGWLRTFTLAAVPGAYLRVLTPGHLRAEDRVEVVHRPEHDVTVSLVFRALTREPQLLPAILAAEDLPEGTRAMALAGRTFSVG